MEDLAAYAVMASASVGLYKELLFPLEDNRIPYSRRDSGFIQNRLAALRRQEDEDDDMTIALLSTMWQDEVIAHIAESNAAKKNTNPGAVLEEQNVPNQAPSSSSQVQRPAKRTKTTSYSPYEEFGLRLNLDSSHYSVGVNPYQPASQYNVANDFYSGDAYRMQHHFNVPDNQRRLQVEGTVSGDPLENHQHQLPGDHLGDELALGNEHPFMTQHHIVGGSYSENQEHSSRDEHHWDSDLQSQANHHE